VWDVLSNREADAERLQSIVKTRLQGEDFPRLHSENQVELLAGYTAIPSQYKRASSTLDYISRYSTRQCTVWPQKLK